MDTALATYVKHPDAILDYELDWSTYLGGGDTIVDAVWAVSSGLTIVSEAFTTTTTTVRISGGTAGNSYTAAVHITLDSGQEDERTLAIAVVEV